MLITIFPLLFFCDEGGPTELTNQLDICFLYISPIDD